MNNILFIESKKHLQELGIFKNIIKFNGNKNYKISNQKLDQYNLIISQFYTNPISNFLIIKAGINNIPTLLLADGIVEWGNCFSNSMNKKYNLNQYHPIFHDMFLCVGREETKYFNFLGYKTMQYLPKRIAPTMAKLDRPNNKTFLITTANTAYYNDDEKRYLINLINDVMKSLDKISSNYIFRIFDDSLVERLNLENEKNVKDGTFEECLKLVDCVITTPSSISLTTMYHNRSLAHLIYRDSPMLIHSGWNISTSVDIDNSLQSMLTFDKDRMNFQEFQVSNYMADNDKVEIEVTKELQKQKNGDIEKFINQNLYNMLNSSFNFNIEYFVRKIYLRFKGLKIVKYLRGKVK